MMNTPQLIALSAAAMLILALPRKKKYKLSNWKVLLIIAWTMGFGLLGTFIVYFIENGTWGGISFYGAVLLIPLFILPLAKLMRRAYSEITDFVAAPGLGMFAVHKFNCYLTECCDGRIIGHTSQGIPIYFPSQIVEIAVGLAIACIALILEHFERFRGKVYPVCLILYGSVRYVLNFYRKEQSIFLLGLAPGNFWSLVAIGVGIIWLLASRKKPQSK